MGDKGKKDQEKRKKQKTKQQALICFLPGRRRLSYRNEKG